MGLGFVYLTWTERIWGITSSPQGTAILLLGLLVAGMVMAAVYKGRAFCRYICPIGALCGLYSMTSVTELRSRGTDSCQGCDKQCFRGDGSVEGCPLYQYTRTMDTNRNCNLCGQCVKSCPHGAVEWKLRTPGKELWLIREPQVGESLLVLLLVGMVYIQTIDMTTAWSSYMRWFLESTPVDSYELGFTLTFVSALGAAVGLYMLATRWSGSAASWGRNFKTFGYAYIPLALSVHLGHNAMHLFTEGPSAVMTAVRAVLAPLGVVISTSTQEGTSDLSLVWMIPFVILGGAASLYVVWRTSKRLEGQDENGKLYPHLILVLLLIALFVQLFLLPMNPRHTH
jgi:NAD-dependent dihydropyrimidine dehydrogenase PreA subunit